MFKKLALYILITINTAAIASCNSDSEEVQQQPISTSSAIVTSFTLAENDKILENLDSVYFSIDLNNALIYNADSLPYGTATNRLVVKITTDGCSVAELYIPGSNGTEETVVNYLTNSTDSIDFSNGAVRLHLVSTDQSTSRDYRISVNVHKMKPDSLYWNQVAKRILPTEFGYPSAQKTILFNGQAVCLATDGNGRYSIGTSPSPEHDNWETSVVSFPFTPDINSLTSTEDAVYILDGNGTLYSTTDWLTWTSRSTGWNYIYGGYENSVLGNSKNVTGYEFVTYPETTPKELSSDFPISGTSQLITVTTDWGTTQAMMIGGKDRAGKISGDAWGYDGNNWAKISVSPIAGREGMALFSYPTFKTDTDNWTVTKYTTWIAIGGKNQAGNTVKDVYISFDQGIHWKLADDLMQLPDYVPAMAYSQALVFSSALESASSGDWDGYAPKTIPSRWSIETESYQPRIANIETQWDCPYIYLFGGVSSDGRLYNSIWKGVINRLTFRPLQ